MGLREKKRNQRCVLTQRTSTPRAEKEKDFLPLEGGRGKRILEDKPEEPENKAIVLYMRYIPMASTRIRYKVSFSSLGLSRGLGLPGTARYERPSTMDSLSLRTLIF